MDYCLKEIVEDTERSKNDNNRIIRRLFNRK